MTDLRGAHKEVRDLLRKAEQHGCDVSRTKSGHWRVSKPGRPSVTVANSPSDPRAFRNTRADLRRNLGVPA